MDANAGLVVTCSDMNSSILALCSLSAREDHCSWKQKVKFCYMSSTFLCHQLPSMKALLNISASVLSLIWGQHNTHIQWQTEDVNATLSKMLYKV